MTSLGQISDRVQIPDGTWSVDPERSQITFAVKAMWGLTTVHGRFGPCRGGLTVDGPAASGELDVDVSGLSTGNGRRDDHLRSPDFFDAERHPWVRFSLVTLTVHDGEPTVVGDLRVRIAETRLSLPVEATLAADGGLSLHATTTVSRQGAGVAWNWLGTIADDAALDIQITLSAEAR